MNAEGSNGNYAEKILNGYTVLDFTTNISGPSATAILSDLGAEIIKIEKINHGDDSRSMQPSLDNKSAYFIAINRSKKSIAINIKDNEGRKIIERLIEKADIFIENFRRNTVQSLKLDYNSVKKINNRIIYGSIKSYGNCGPMSNNPGYDAIIQAETGIMSINGNKNGKPARVGVSVLDAGSAMWLAIAVLAAVIKRERTGEGSMVSTSLYETGLYWMNYYIEAFQMTGKIPSKSGSEHMSFAPYGAFRASDGYIMIGISNDNLFSRLSDAIKMPELKYNIMYKTNKDRVGNRKKLNKLLETVFIKHTGEYWIKLLKQNFVPCAIIKDVKDVIEAEQTHAINPFQIVTENGKELKVQSVPISVNGNHFRIDKPSPELGEDTYNILSSLGYPKNEIKNLISLGIVKQQL